MKSAVEEIVFAIFIVWLAVRQCLFCEAMLVQLIKCHSHLLICLSALIPYNSPFLTKQPHILLDFCNTS